MGGEKPECFLLLALSGDHPRVGGEKFQKPIDMLQDTGSPPRGRGKVQNIGSSSAKTGITPAWAGKRRKRKHRQDIGRDHPRVGGEKIERLLGMDCDTGSPPRGRGKGVYEIDTELRYGITPAWAGKRADKVADADLVQDHPRVGGEKTKKIP